jgi:hypothetical protein
MTSFHANRCEQSELMCAYALQVLPAREVAVGSPHRFVPGLPARVGEPAPGRQSFRLLAHRCAASNYIASGTPCLTHR